MKRLTILIAFTLIAGCGKQEALRPATGQALPQKPAMARETPSTDELLTPTAEARPSRNVEAVRHSEERKPDPFDLPPK